MEYNIKNITDLNKLTSLYGDDMFLIGRDLSTYYSTYKTTFDTLSSLVLRNVQQSLLSVYTDISCLNDDLKDEYHNHQVDAYVIKQLMDSIHERTYPIGSIYITTLTANPSRLLHFGKSTWVKVCQGRCLMGADNDSHLSTNVEQSLPIPTKVTSDASGLRTTINGEHQHGCGGPYGDSYWGGGTGSQEIMKDFCKSVSTWGGDTSHSHDITGTISTEINEDDIYKKDANVQPPAFMVNIWTRIS